MFHNVLPSRRFVCNQYGAEHDVPLTVIELAKKHNIPPTVLVCDKKNIDIQAINDKIEYDRKYYLDPLFDRFRAFRTTDDPRSLQNIILRKQREQLRVENYTKYLEDCKEEFIEIYGETKFDEFIEWLLDYYPDDCLDNYEEIEEHLRLFL